MLLSGCSMQTHISLTLMDVNDSLRHPFWARVMFEVESEVILHSFWYSIDHIMCREEKLAESK